MNSASIPYSLYTAFNSLRRIHNIPSAFSPLLAGADLQERRAGAVEFATHGVFEARPPPPAEVGLVLSVRAPWDGGLNVA